MATPMDFILASRSPRRASLLHEAGFAFEQMGSPFVDPAKPARFFQSQSPLELAVELAKQKALALYEVLPAARQAGSLILAADTIALSPDGSQLLGTPTNREQAAAMLRTFSGTSHQVISGICLFKQGQVLEAFADEAVVHLGMLSDEQIEAYLNTDDWQGKAGGYNLFDRQAAGWPITTTGDPTTIVGLPMKRLLQCRVWEKTTET